MTRFDIHFAGFPEFMQFREFVQKFQSLVPPSSRPSASMDDKQVKILWYPHFFPFTQVVGYPLFLPYML